MQAMATPQTPNPNQPPPVVLASNLNPPPVFPLPNANWLSLPVVPPPFPQGPFPPPTIANPGTGQWPGPSTSPGTGLGGPPTAPAHGIITAAAVTAGGSGYTSAPTVTVNTTTGSGANLVAVESGGVVTGIQVLNGGVGYAATDTITISGGGGTGATGTITVAP